MQVSDACRTRIRPALWRARKAKQVSSSGSWLDAEDFKKFNDIYGHPRGDLTLIAVVVAFRQSASRSGGSFARYSGNEFGLLVPETDQPDAELVAAACEADMGWLSAHFVLLVSRKELWLGTEAQPLFFADESPTAGVTVERLLAMDDGALYAAKQAGRARTSDAYRPGRRTMSCQLVLRPEHQGHD